MKSKYKAKEKKTALNVDIFAYEQPREKTDENPCPRKREERTNRAGKKSRIMNATRMVQPNATVLMHPVRLFSNRERAESKSSGKMLERMENRFPLI